MKKYQIIGGQYAFCRKGESDSLHGAKIIASKNQEYWDNWQGWRTPSIYHAEDCMQIEPTSFNFSGIVPRPGSMPVASKDASGRWCTSEDAIGCWYRW